MQSLRRTSSCASWSCSSPRSSCATCWIGSDGRTAGGSEGPAPSRAVRVRARRHVLHVSGRKNVMIILLTCDGRGGSLQAGGFAWLWLGLWGFEQEFQACATTAYRAPSLVPQGSATSSPHATLVPERAASRRRKTAPLRFACCPEPSLRSPAT